MTELVLHLPRARPAVFARLRALTAGEVALGTTVAAIGALPLLVPNGPSNIAPADAFIVVAVVATLVWSWREHRIWRYPYVVPMILYMIGGALGALAGPVPATGAVALAQDALLLLFCWAIVNVSSTPGRLGTVVSAWAYSAIAWAVLMFVGLASGATFLSGVTTRDGARTSLTLHDPNYAADYFFVSLMVVWASGRPRHPGARVAATLLLIAAIVSTGSNSGIFSLLTGTLTALLIVLYRRRGLRAVAAALALVLMLGALITGTHTIARIQGWAQSSSYAFIRDGIGRESSSVSDRGLILHESLQLYRESGLWLGRGPVSTKTRLAAEQASYVKEAHDDYVGTLLERGVIGAVGLILLVGSVLARAVVPATHRPGRSLAAAVPHPNALAGAVVGALVGGAFIELLHARHVWALFALAAVVGIRELEWRTPARS